MKNLCIFLVLLISSLSNISTKQNEPEKKIEHVELANNLNEVKVEVKSESSPTEHVIQPPQLQNLDPQVHGKVHVREPDNSDISEPQSDLKLKKPERTPYEDPDNKSNIGILEPIKPMRVSKNFNQILNIANRKAGVKIVGNQDALNNSPNIQEVYGTYPMCDQQWYYSQSISKSESFLSSEVQLSQNRGASTGDDSSCKTTFTLAFLLPCKMKRLNVATSYVVCMTGGPVSGNVYAGVRAELFLDNLKRLDSWTQRINYTSTTYKSCQTVYSEGNLFNVPAGQHYINIKLCSLNGSIVTFQESNAVANKEDMPVSVNLTGCPEK